METPDFFSLLPEDKKSMFHVALVLLFDKMLNEAGISDQEELQRLALLRAKIDIELKDFN